MHTPLYSLLPSSPGTTYTCAKLTTAAIVVSLHLMLHPNHNTNPNLTQSNTKKALTKDTPLYPSSLPLVALTSRLQLSFYANAKLQFQARCPSLLPSTPKRLAMRAFKCPKYGKKIVMPSVNSM